MGIERELGNQTGFLRDDKDHVLDPKRASNLHAVIIFMRYIDTIN